MNINSNNSSNITNSSKNKISPIALFAIIVFAILLVASFVWYIMQKKNSSIEITYREEEVIKTDIETTITSTGVVQPENRLEIKPPIAGRVENILVKEGELVKKGQILAWMSSTERAALLDAARAKGESELRKWEGLYRPTPIMAPINGMIILRKVESGQTFANDDYVFIMSDRLTVKAQVDETDISQITLDQNATITLDAYSKDSIPAQVDKIAYDAKTVNNVTTYIVDVLPKDPPTYMRSGMTANVTFILTSKKAVSSIPNEAIKNQEGKMATVLKKIDSNSDSNSNTNSNIETTVEVGVSDGKRTEIISGLADGEKVLVADFKTLSKDRNLAGAAAGAGSSLNPFNPMRGIKRATAGVNGKRKNIGPVSGPATSPAHGPPPPPGGTL